MGPDNAYGHLDRHALVMTIWLPVGFIATIVGHRGFLLEDGWWVLAAFGAVLAGFACHVIANAVLGTDFTVREVALGLVLFVALMLGLGLATLLVDGFAARFLLPVAGGMAMLVAAVAFYMITRYGVRSAFDKFDVIRDFNPRATSRLPHRGGRR